MKKLHLALLGVFAAGALAFSIPQASAMPAPAPGVIAADEGIDQAHWTGYRHRHGWGPRYGYRYGPHYGWRHRPYYGYGYGYGYPYRHRHWHRRYW